MQQPEHIQRAVETRRAKRDAVHAEQERTVLRIIEQAARLGNECPSAARLASACGLHSESGGRLVLDRLQAKGLVEVVSTGRTRVVHVVESGLKTAGQLTGRDAERMLLKMIKVAAERGEECPSNATMAAALGVTPQAAINIVKRMETAGTITVRRASQSRVVTIVATGEKTAGEVARERIYAGRKVTTDKARFAKALAEAVHTNDLSVPCAILGITEPSIGERLFAEICHDLGPQAQ